jgi:hypothetical protein
VRAALPVGQKLPALQGTGAEVELAQVKPPGHSPHVTLRTLLPGLSCSTNISPPAGFSARFQGDLKALTVA